MNELYYKLDEHIGKTLTYKDICNICDIRYYKGGTSKQRQLNEIQCLYKLEKSGTKYNIISKYDKPLDIEDNRESKYYKDLEALLLYALYKAESYNVTWSVSRCIKLCQFISNNYYVAINDLDYTSKALEIEKEKINDFCNITNNKLKSILDTTLKKMERKGLISLRADVDMVCVKDVKLEYNLMRKVVIYDDNSINYEIEKSIREATGIERRMIAETKEKVLKELNLTDTKEAMLKCWDKYNNMFRHRLKKDCNIEYTYKAYNIVINKRAVNENYKNISINRHNLNNLIIKALYESENKKLLSMESDEKEVLIDSLVKINSIYDLDKIIANIKKIEQEELKALLEEENEVIPF